MKLLKLALALGLFLAATPVLAQENEPSTGGGMMGGPGMMRSGMMGQGDLKAMVERQLAYVKTALGITEGEGPAWKAYEDAVRANEQSMQTVHEAMVAAMRSGTAIDRLQKNIAIMQARLDALKEAQPATEALYKALTPEQQKKADMLLVGTSGGMM
jgi:Spy/CpxP family protein refolding chaperone